jgi:hypothetical protein
VPAQKTEDRHKSSLTAVQSAKNQPGLSTSASYIAVLAMTAAQSLKRLTNFPEAVNPKHLDHSKKIIHSSRFPTRHQSSRPALYQKANDTFFRPKQLLEPVELTWQDLALQPLAFNELLLVRPRM